MNLLILLLGLRLWSAPTARSRFTRVLAAVALVSVEMQAATWLGIGSLRSLIAVNVAVAAGLWVGWRPLPPAPDDVRARLFDAVPWLVVVPLLALVAGLNLGLPLEAADPYHLDRVAQIERSGTLAYDAGADVKTNILSPVYELALADLGQVPGVGGLLVRLHGVLGLLLWLLAVGSARELLRSGRGWPWALLATVPVVFHQLVLVKNDLFVGAIGLVVLAWVVARSGDAPARETAWASWLCGMSVAIKLTSLPLLVVLAGTLLLRRVREPRVIAAAALGGLAGLVAGGLAFNVVENIRVYGALMPSADIGGRTTGVLAAVESLGLFGVSLFDLGLLSPQLSPGRGGWGGTFGLPMVWALAVLALAGRRLPEARAALAAAAVYFLLFAGAFADADISQRMAIGPGVLLIAVAVHVLGRMETGWSWLRAAALPVLLLSAAQIVRSAVLYVIRG